MANLAFAPQHNMVPYLEKTESNAEFHQIVDFITSSSIHHALTVSPTIYGSNIKQFWNTANSQTINDEKQIRATINGKTVVITESSVIRDLLFNDDNGITGHTPGSDEGSMTLKELMDLCTTLSQKGSGEKGGSTAETVSTARPDISAARLEVSTTEPKTPPTTTTLFDDEDVTIADNLVKMKSQKAKEKGAAFKDADDSARPIRSITTLQPLPTIDPKDKGKGILQEPKSVKKTKERYQDQIERDAEVALKIQADLDEEVRTERERQKEASKAALAELKKRAAGLSSKQKSPKKQKVNYQESVDSDKELNKCLKALGTMEAGDVHVYKLTRLDGSYRHLLTFSRMLKVLNRQDVLDLHKIVMERFSANDPEGYDLILWEDLKTLMESSEDDEIWRNQQDWKLLSWKLYETCGVYALMLDDSLVSINMFVEKRYPLTKEILEKMLSWRLEAETESTLALDLIKFIKLQI
uniref:Xylulose kinase-1 n=1 Tax=Tanacetum cinerariifolium TaxID=118510 RepID=A0A6L2NQL9_TANCI|nr:hypothetical protein [Tanacetum cinerariifolium]